MTLGRPPCVPRNIVDYVTLPEPVDDDGYDYTCFVQTCKLTVLLDKVLGGLYNCTKEDALQRHNPMDVRTYIATSPLLGCSS